MRDRGALTNSPKDIGPLMDEVCKDILDEERQYIYDQLMAAAKNRINRGVVKGLAQWYKDKLLNSQFDKVGVQEFMNDNKELFDDLAKQEELDKNERP